MNKLVGRWCSESSTPTGSTSSGTSRIQLLRHTTLPETGSVISNGRANTGFLPALAAHFGTPVHPVQRTGLLLLVGVASLALIGSHVRAATGIATCASATQRPRIARRQRRRKFITRFAPRGTSTVAYAGSVAASTHPTETTPPPDHSASNLRVDGAKLAEVRLAAEPERTTQADEFLYVQVGFYSHSAEAHSLVERLRKRGFTAYASELGSSQLYRVQLGPYTTSEAADMTQDALKEVGFDSFEAVENKRIQMRP